MAVLAGVGASASASAASALVPAVAIVLNLMCFQVTLVNATALDARGEGAVIISSVESFAQQTVITGSVVDTAGRPMLGVSVAVKGTRTQIMTNAEGKFIIQSSDSSGEIVASFIGYQSVAVSFGSGAGMGPFKIVLVPLEHAIEEVVIDGGYYETTKRLSTGNIAKVEAATIARQPVTNPLQALNGQVSGVRLQQVNGLPGTPVSLEIRGRNSIRSGSEPLYLVDGIPYYSGNIAGVNNYTGVSPLESINLNDIENITILKDADATAIYGSRGANGVVLINTKKSYSHRSTIDVNVNSGIGEPTRLLEPLSTEQYLQVRRDAFKNSGIEPNLANAPDLMKWDPNVDNKMQDWLISNVLRRLNSSVTLQGGNEHTRFKFSGNYGTENTIFSKSDQYQRINSHVNFYHAFNSKVKIDVTTLYSRYKNEASNYATAALNYIASFVPNYPIYNDLGEYNWEAGKQNLKAASHSGWRSTTNNFNSNISLLITPDKNLTFKMNMGYNKIFNSSNIPFLAISKNPSTNPQGSNSFTESEIESIVFEPQMNYSINVDKNQIRLYTGITIQSTNDLRNTSIVESYINDLLIHSRSGGVASFIRSTHSEYRYISLFSRLHYNLAERYIFNASIRKDGSSRFGPGKRFGLFGSVGAAWLFAEELILKDNLPWLSTGKLRGSYGSSGNDNIGNYAYLSVYNTVADYGNQKAIAPNQLANDNYHWEVNKKLELATELGFLNDRLTMDVSWYRNISDNQLVAYPIPATTGFTSYTANMPALVQNKGWEVDMRFTPVQNSNFTWSTSLNWTRHRNKLLEFPNIERTTYANSLIIGESLNSVLRYRFIEVDPQTGHTVVEDVNGDGLFISRSSYNNQGGDYVNIGNFDPKWCSGLTNSMNWKNLNFSFSLQYIRQSGFNIYVVGSRTFGGLDNVWPQYLSYWKEPGDISNVPKPYASIHNSNTTYAVSSATFSDASFLRMNNVSLSYKIKDCLIYVNAQNLMTWTNYNGYDPENVSLNNLTFPPIKMVVFGFKTSIK